MRTCLLFLAIPLLLAGCGISSANSPTATPAPTPTSTAVPVPGAKYNAYPPMTIRRNHQYTADLATSDGTFTIQLLPKLAPLAVNSFVFLARHGFYNGVPFHRIIQDFVIQSGDPTGTGFGGPGYTFKDELHKHMSYPVGTVAMAHSSLPNSNGSQFFIVSGPKGRTNLDPNPQYTIFGKVIRGLIVVFRIATTPVTIDPATGQAEQPLVKVTLKRVIIHESR